ncbi:MAG: hypothetical protein AB2L13_12385 [Spirochaetota bacterium]
MLEGFPVLLANATESYQFSIEGVRNLLNNKPGKELFHALLLLSAALYSFYHLSIPQIARFMKELPPGDKLLVKKWRNSLVHNRIIAGATVTFDPERLKRLFTLYFEQNARKTRQKKDMHEGFSLSFALSQIFSPKQRDLFMKKLEGLPLSKTEQEYYSRSVKKKVVALASSELHSLAQKILEK